VRLLLDTHLLLWWLADDPALGAHARELISTPEHLIFFSAASIWEIWIKQSIGKLDLPDDFADVLADQAMEPLAVTVDHAHALRQLPLIHRDPFDRMLIAQAQMENLPIVTADDQFLRYEVEIIWAGHRKPRRRRK
jgi:PIN domain nuclease of toxin-antitoxin system